MGKSQLDTITAFENANEYRETWNVLIAGDVTPRNRFEGQHITTESHISRELRSDITSADISLANHEGPIETDSSPITKSGPNIEVDEQTPEFLRAVGFDAVTLANNHIMDYGNKGMQNTMAACEDADLRFCGSGDNFSDAIQPLVMEPNDGPTVGIINVCEREFGVAGIKTPGAAWVSHPKTLLAVAQTAAKTDVVIVIAHGGVENIPVPPLQRQHQLRCFIDSGADLVVGHHPHVPQGWEQYNNGMIFYSLGNFLFDRNPPTPRDKKEKEGLVIDVKFDGARLMSARLVPTEVSNHRVHHLGTERDRGTYLDYLHSLADIASDTTLLESYWQQIAIDRFIKYYGRHLYRTSTGNPLRALRYPVTRRHRWNASRREEEMLWLFNLVRNESKCWLMETALGVLSGKIEDKRTPEIRQHTQHLLDSTLPVRYEWLKKHL
ncbi:CapA family protein [Natrialbaceae archaeon A-arb3/5]